MTNRTILFATLFALGCHGRADDAGDTDRPTEDAPSLEESREPGAPRVTEATPYMLASLTIDGEDVPIVLEAPITLVLGPDNAVSGHAGVNRYSATPTVDESGRYVWPEAFATTKMAGPEPLMKREDAYLSALRRSDWLRVEKDHVVFESEDGAVRLVFK